MSNTADREVWLNFLDEVDEYLNTIESGLIGLAETGIDSQRMAAALRAVHTIKGIGSMIECPSLSHLAHQFEDALKIVSARREVVQMDAVLETLLLQGIDGMRQISARHRQALPIDEAWLAEYAYPTYEHLRDRLGELQPSDELSLLAAESETNTAVVMFETEVEELLGRLETVLADPTLPCLQEELEMMVEELHDLGRMLQLDAFTSLCASIQQTLKTASPPQIEPIARQALELWQRSQALVMVNKLEKLPTRLDPFFEEGDTTAIAADETAPGFIAAFAELPLADESPDFDALELGFGRNDMTTAESDIPDHSEESITADSVTDSSGTNLNQLSPSDAEEIEQPLTDAIAATAPIPDQQPPSSDNFDGFADIDFDSIQSALENFDPADFRLDALASDEASVLEEISEPVETSKSGRLVDDKETVEDTSSDAQIKFSLPPQTKAAEETLEVLVETLGDSSSAKTQEVQENTVRVPLKLLTQLNDLFGELIIQRNTMNSRLGQMEDLMALFSQRMVSLEGTNTELQTFCNQITVATSLPTLHERNGTTPNGELSPQQPSPSKASSGPSSGPPPLAGNPLQSEFDSLELDRYSDLHLLSQEQRETLVQLREVTSDVKLNLREIKQASSNLNRTAQSLQINVTRARMRPLADIVERFPRTVRDLSLQYNKTVDLQIHGGGTLIDRFVAVHLRDPLMHLLRNAFDHGIEDTATRQAQGKPTQGKIEIRAAHRGSQTLISISDDGAGINLTKIRDRASQLGLTADLLDNMSEADLLGLIFEPGFSTADEVTDLSGRGIGMDVVRNNLEQIRSEIKVDTQPSIGTTFTISVPFTLSIVRVLLVESGGMQLAFPTDSIEEMIRLKGVQVFDSPEQKVINWEGLTVPLIQLDQWLDFRCPLRSLSSETAPIISEPSILIVSRGDRLSGIYIDRFWGEREVVIRQVENVISLPTGFSGCTILEDGNVVPLADAVKLLDWIDRDDSASTISQHWQHLLQSSPVAEAATDDLQYPALLQAEQTTILVVDDSINMRHLLGTTLERAGYSVEQGKDGQDAVDQLLNGLSVHAVVCDIEMPRLDGYGVLTEIRDNPKLKDLPVIMLTSRSSDKHRQLAMRLGATAYITKPYQEHELLQMIEQILQQQPLSTV
ncbi:MAG: response regulator [Cyanobacteria bacterium P01_F01_bin.86]